MIVLEEERSLELLVEVKSEEDDKRWDGGEEDNCVKDVNVLESDWFFFYVYV